MTEETRVMGQGGGREIGESRVFTSPIWVPSGAGGAKNRSTLRLIAHLKMLLWGHVDTGRSVCRPLEAV